MRIILPSFLATVILIPAGFAATLSEHMTVHTATNDTSEAKNSACLSPDDPISEHDKGVRWLDRPHGLISDGVLLVSDRIDRFFDASADEEVGETRLKISTGTEWREGGSMRFKTGAGARLDLPRLERRWNLLLENIDLSEDTLTEQEIGDDFSAGLRLLLRATRRTRLHADGGLRFSDGPITFARLRLRRKYDWNPHALYLTQFGHWYDRKGFGATSRIEYERALAENHLFQARTEIDWEEDVKGVKWQHRISLTRLLRQRHGWSLFGSVDGATTTDTVIETYRTGILYRNRLYKDWLFMEISPALEFRREHDFDPEPLMTLKMEVIFGKLSLPSHGIME